MAHKATMLAMGFGPCISRRAFLAGVSALALGACGAERADVGKAGTEVASAALNQRTFFCFDTVCVIGAAPDGAGLDVAVRACKRYEQLFSRTIATSDVGRVNAAGGVPTAVDVETVALISAALGYCGLSGGSFDITIGAVSELWDFHAGTVPAPAAIEAALPHVGWQGVEVDEAARTVRLADPAARIDLGGIAKGYVADRVLEGLTDAGATCAFVNLGGNVAVRGGKPDGSPWGVGVRDPFAADGDDLVARVVVTDGSVVTSGLYERSFEANGRRYWHILDPRTGYPVETSIASASVLSSRSLDGDGLTKPLFFMEPADALVFAAAQGIDVLLVNDAGEVLVGEGTSFELL